MKISPKANSKNILKNLNTLCELPDCILLHILSFLNAKHAVQTSILSKRWNYLWKHLSILTLDYKSFNKRSDFNKFVSQILSRRDSSTTLQVLSFTRLGLVEPYILKKIVKYSILHNIQHLQLFTNWDHRHIPPYIISSNTLTSLTLGCYGYWNQKIAIFPNFLSLPLLKNLTLRRIAFLSGDGCAQPFSSFNRLNRLLIDDCQVWNSKTLCVSAGTTLADLRVIASFGFELGERFKIQISIPSCSVFGFSGIPFYKLYGNGLSFIKKVNIDISTWQTIEHSVLLNWLIQFTGIESLIVSPSTLQALSLVPDLLKVELPSLCNLKWLKVKMKSQSYKSSMSILRDVTLEQAAAKSWKECAKLREAVEVGSGSSLCVGMVEFLLRNSPSAKVDIIEDCDESLFDYRL